MKKILILTFIIGYLDASAQINDPAQIAKQKAEQKANAKIDQAIDKGLNTAFDLILSGKKSKKNTDSQKPSEGTTNQQSGTSQGISTTEIQVDNGEAKQANDAIDRVFGQIGNLMSFDTKPKTMYSFSSSIVQKMTITEKSKAETSYLKLHMSNGQPNIGITFLDANRVSQAEKGIIVMDLEQLAFFMFATDKKGEKTYFGMKLKQPNTAENTSETTSSVQKQKSFVPTGTRKTIMGYQCDGYMTETEQGDKTIYWTTNAAIEGMNQYSKAMNQYNAQQRQGDTNDQAMYYFRQQGKTIMGYDIISRKGTKTELELDAISPNDIFNFSSSNYQSAFDK